MGFPNRKPEAVDSSMGKTKNIQGVEAQLEAVHRAMHNEQKKNGNSQLYRNFAVDEYRLRHELRDLRRQAK